MLYKNDYWNAVKVLKKIATGGGGSAPLHGEPGGVRPGEGTAADDELRAADDTGPDGAQIQGRDC